MKLICIRHTKVAVPAGICYGQTDVPLAQSYPAEQLAVLQQLPEGKFDAVFSSPLQRCRLLARDLFAANEIILDDRLKELNFGDWENRSWDEISQTSKAKAWFEDFVSVECPNGEAFTDLMNRTAAFLDELRLKDYARVAIVTHGGILRSLDCLLKGTAPLDAFQTKFDFGQVVSFNLETGVA